MPSTEAVSPLKEPIVLGLYINHATWESSTDFGPTRMTERVHVGASRRPSEIDTMLNNRTIPAPAAAISLCLLPEDNQEESQSMVLGI
jgi:hypothetical protein